MNLHVKSRNVISISILIFISLILTEITYSQSIKVSAGIGYQFHLEGTKSHGYILPFFDRHNVATNSIYEFYDNKESFNIGVSYKFSPHITRNLSLGLEYERSVLSSKFDEVNIILGEEFTLNSLTPNISFGKYLNNHGNITLIGNLGFTIMFPSGEAHIEGYKFSHNYTTEVFIRLGLSVEFEEVIMPNFGFAIGLRGFIGNQSRDIVEVKYKGESTILDPIGSNDLQDNTITPFLNIQYKFGL